MKRLLIAACLALAGCATTAVPVGPAPIANQTVLDEKVAISAELAYTAAVRAAALAIRTGVVSDAATIRQIGELDRKAKAAVGAVRSAYDAGNAASFTAAFAGAQSAITAILALVAR